MKNRYVYKYRSCLNKEIFERDLKSIEKNIFFAPCSEKLNDPCETFVLMDNYRIQSKIIKKMFGAKSDKEFKNVDSAFKNLIDRKNKVGIYSLSRTYHDELLWAHYANSHLGFCIEYDLDKLLKTYSNNKIYHFAIKYSNFPHQPNLTRALSNDLISNVKMLTGRKSKRWKYEKEYRLVIDKCGNQIYDHTALIGIYFGLRMDDKYKDLMLKTLSGRPINFYQMKQIDNSYGFEAVLIKDSMNNKETYLKEIPSNITRTSLVKYEIEDKKYDWALKKGTVEIILDDEVNKDSLEWLANQIRDNLFLEAERVYMYYWIKGVNNKGICWATTHFENNIIKVLTN